VSCCERPSSARHNRCIATSIAADSVVSAERRKERWVLELVKAEAEKLARVPL